MWRELMLQGIQHEIQLKGALSSLYHWSRAQPHTNVFHTLNCLANINQKFIEDFYAVF